MSRAENGSPRAWRRASSHAQLLEIAAAGWKASTEVQNQADAILAAHKPLAQWAGEGVLLSSDLVPHLLAPLQLEDGAAAAVCSRWADGWKATSEGNQRGPETGGVRLPSGSARQKLVAHGSDTWRRQAGSEIWLYSPRCASLLAT